MYQRGLFVTRAPPHLKIMVTHTITTTSIQNPPNDWAIFDSHLIPTHPELNRIALKQQIDAEYLLWCVLRHVAAADGLSSHYNKSDAYDVALQADLSWTRRQFNRILIAGNGIFWGLDAGHIFLRSFERVYKMLADDTAAANRQPQFVAIEVQKSAAARRAELYWSWFLIRGEQTISRDSIQDLFGLSPDQQRAYEKLLQNRMIVHTNYCHIDADLYKEQLNLPTYSFEFIQERFIDNKITYVKVVAYQLPNTYFARPMQSGESPVAKTPKRAKHAAGTLYRLTLACGFQRRWFQFYDEFEALDMPDDSYIRTAFQGTKHIWRSGHYF